jgi:hypothetical protein
MKHIVITSDKYRHLMPEFAERFNKFIGMNKCDVLCYQSPPELPDNFNIVNLGVQPDNKIWTTPLIPYFQDITEPFMLLLEDYYITAPIDDYTMMDIYNNCVWDKIDLSTDRTHFQHFAFGDVVVSAQTARYRSSLQAAIWKPEYFREFLKPDRTAWEFELLGEKEAMGDGANILGTTTGILKYDNVMLKGQIHESYRHN